MEYKSSYIELPDLQVCQLARQLSKVAWTIYLELDWQTKKIIGDQFIEATDSIGSNIAEGYGRYHYLDKIKFYYNARASYNEAIIHWLEILKERHLIKNSNYLLIWKIAKEFAPRFNSFIAATYNDKQAYQISNF